MFEEQNQLSRPQSSENQTARSVIIGPGLAAGESHIILMAGPCSVENYAQVRVTAEEISRAGCRVLRGGVYKPRTSPESFQGLGIPALEILRAVADEFGLLVISEALGVEHVPIVAEYIDIIQIGSRNMQHYPLSWAVGELENALSDGLQSLPLTEPSNFYRQVGAIANALKRELN